MKNYFEKKFNKEIAEKLSDYYENVNLEMHSGVQVLKTKMKYDRLSKMIVLSKHDEVLDIGCSSGYLLNLLYKKVKNCLGIDIAKKVILECKKNNKFKNVKYETFDGESIKTSEKFNKIFMLDVLEHAFCPNKLLKSAIDHLKENGEIILEVPFTGFISELVTKEYHQGHLRYYDPEYLEKYFHKMNLKIVKLNVYNSVPFASVFLKNNLIWRIADFLINLFPSRYYPYFGTIDVIAKKYEK